MKKFYISLFIWIAVNGSALAEVTEAKVKSLFEQWNLALATTNPDEVVKLYSPKAVLLPTVSDDVRVGHTEIRSYFVDFLQYKPQGKIIESHIKVLDDDVAVDNGIYVFTLMKDNKPQEVTARYSFVYQKVNEIWYILVHHSSQMPSAMK